MWLLIIEAFIALGMLVFIIWWTMSSRRRNEHTLEQAQPPALAASDAAVQAQGDPAGKDVTGKS